MLVFGLIAVLAVIILYVLVKKGKISESSAYCGVIIPFLFFSAQYIPSEYLSLEVINIFNHNSTVVREKLYIGEELDLSEDNQSKKSVKWMSADEDIVTVDNSGRVTALAEGTADVYLKTKFNRTIKTWSLSVSSPRIRILSNDKEICVKETKYLKYETIPKNEEVIWESSDSTVATVDKMGKIEAISNGSVSISATMNYAGKTYSQEHQIIVGSPGVTLSEHNITLFKGGKKSLSAKTYPSDQIIEWESSDAAIASVDKNGKIVAEKSGKAEVSATIYYKGTKYKDKCEIVVDSAPIELSEVYTMAYQHGGFNEEKDVVDIYGKTWEGPAYNARLEWFNGYEDGQSSERYYIDGQYACLYGTIVLPSDQYNTRYTAYVKIYGDDRVLYTSPPISAAFAPLGFEVDVSGVSELEIELGGHWTIGDADCKPVITGVYLK